MKIKFPDSNELGGIFGVTRREYHRKIKPYILSDFRDELNEKAINNPDIGIDQNNFIYLSDSKHEEIITTNQSVEDYS